MKKFKISCIMLLQFLLSYSVLSITLGQSSSLCVDKSTLLKNNQSIHCYSNVTKSGFENIKISSASWDFKNLTCKGLQISSCNNAFNWTCYEQSNANKIYKKYLENNDSSEIMLCVMGNGSCKENNTGSGKKCFLIIRHPITAASTTPKPETSTKATSPTNSSTKTVKVSKLPWISSPASAKVTRTIVRTVTLQKVTTKGLKMNTENGLPFISGWVFGGIVLVGFLLLLVLFKYKRRKSSRREEYQLNEINRAEQKDENHYQALVFRDEAPANPYQLRSNEATVSSFHPGTASNSNKKNDSFAPRGTIDSNYVICNKRENLVNTGSNVSSEEIYDDVKNHGRASTKTQGTSSERNQPTVANNEQGVKNIKNRLEILFQNMS